MLLVCCTATESPQIREDAGKKCLVELPRSNAPWIMARCGSKGSRINMSQATHFALSMIAQRGLADDRMRGAAVDQRRTHSRRI